jgi:hypothetical protein
MIQPLCGEHLSWVLYLFLNKSEGFHWMIIFIIFHESLALGGYLCVTLLCEKKEKNMGESYICLYVIGNG